jgi:uncharacterized protein
MPPSLETIPGIARSQVAGEQLWLHPFRGAYWARQHTLFVADLHLGKALHFRREGVPVPTAVSQENWDRLIALLLDFRPQRVLFLGDLFHSDYNREWEDFCHTLDQFHEISFELILGNHDSLPPEAYAKANLMVHRGALKAPPFLLTHHPVPEPSPGWYNLAGHLHPCVFLKGRGRLRERLPCYFFGKAGGVLPAFGAFTGMAQIRPKAEEQVYVIAGREVIMV